VLDKGAYSPNLFNLYSEYILRKVGFEDVKGITVGVRRINNIRYAGDTTILAEGKEDPEKTSKKAKGRVRESRIHDKSKEDQDNDNRNQK
jgi:hypothetical protein